MLDGVVIDDAELFNDKLRHHRFAMALAESRRSRAVRRPLVAAAPAPVAELAVGGSTSRNPQSRLMSCRAWV